MSEEDSSDPPKVRNFQGMGMVTVFTALIIGSEYKTGQFLSALQPPSFPPLATRFANYLAVPGSVESPVESPLFNIYTIPLAAS